jgi:hypothetical protein
MAAKNENVSSDGNKIVNTAKEECYHSDKDMIKLKITLLTEKMYVSDDGVH